MSCLLDSLVFVCFVCVHIYVDDELTECLLKKENAKFTGRLPFASVYLLCLVYNHCRTMYYINQSNESGPLQ